MHPQLMLPMCHIATCRVSTWILLLLVDCTIMTTDIGTFCCTKLTLVTRERPITCVSVAMVFPITAIGEHNVTVWTFAALEFVLSAPESSCRFLAHAAAEL